MSVEEPNDPRSWQIANNQIQLTELATYEERAPDVPKPTLTVRPQTSVFIGDSVTLRCDIYDGGVTSWRYNWYKDGSISVFSEGQEHTISVTESDTGKYFCYGADTGGSHSSHSSDEVTLTISERPKPRVTIKPDHHVFRGETVTLRCDIYDGGVTSWRYNWYKDGSTSAFSERQEHTFSVIESDAGKYSCNGTETGGSRSSQHSDEVTLTVSDVPKPTLTVQPQSSVFNGDSVTLTCVLGQSWDGWEFLWSKDSNTESPEAEAETKTKTIRPVKVSDGGKYRCRARRGGYYTDYSNPVAVTIHERPKPRVTIKPDHHVFRGDSVTLRCVIYDEGVTSWRYNWYKDGSISVFSERQEHTFSSVTESDVGKYSCYGTETEGSRSSHRSDEVTLTVSDVPKPTLTVQPKGSVFTGDSVTLTCVLDQSWDGWEFLWRKDSNTEYPEAETKTINPEKVSDGGKYRCRARRGGYYTDYSKPVAVTIHERPKPRVTIKPDHHVFRGETVTLRCVIYDEGVTSWRYNWYKDGSISVFSERQEHTFSPVTESDAGKYSCYGTETGGSRSSLRSDEVTLTVSERPKPRVTIKPDHHVFRGDSVTLRCDIYDEGVTSWRYNWYKDGSTSVFSAGPEHTFSVIESDEGKYSCYGTETGGSRRSQHSDEVTLTVTVPEAVLSVSPQKWLTEGDPVTLICEVNGSSTGWTFSWFTETVSGSSIDHELLSDSSRGSGGKYTVSSAHLNHTGLYVCKGQREKTAVYTKYSNTQPLWVTGVSPPVSLIISPSRTQHFIYDSLSLSCENQSNSDRWTVRRYTDSGQRLEYCSSLVWASQKGSTCTIRSTLTSHTGVYWCQSESGENYHPVNITVHSGVILESPVHPVTEGCNLTLRCLYQYPTRSNIRADFYKDGSLVQNQTTEMIIPTVSKSHEGFYYCKHPKIGESPKSWISVRVSPASGSNGVNPTIIGVTAGLTVVFLLIVFLALLWRYRNNKGVRSESPSPVSHQQNISHGNQRDAGYTTLLSGTSHIYESVDPNINKEISTDGASEPTEITYAEIELKPTKKQKKKKENKGNNTGNDDIYSKLKLETDQNAGSSDVMYAQVKKDDRRKKIFQSGI
ncbi:Fc receptor-like protein [Pimephales promelas]|nr:Fc receptor-like protein [Pimephales promelas]